MVIAPFLGGSQRGISGLGRWRRGGSDSMGEVFQRCGAVIPLKPVQAPADEGRLGRIGSQGDGAIEPLAGPPWSLELEQQRAPGPQIMEKPAPPLRPSP